MITLPVFNDPNWKMDIQLEGVFYTLGFRYNNRVEGWYASLWDADGNPLQLGAKVSVNWPLFNNLVVDGMPTGKLLCVALSEDQDLTRDNLGTDVKIVYATDAEVESFESTSPYTYTIT